VRPSWRGCSTGSTSEGWAGRATLMRSSALAPAGGAGAVPGNPGGSTRLDAAASQAPGPSIPGTRRGRLRRRPGISVPVDRLRRPGSRRTGWTWGRCRRILLRQPGKPWQSMRRWCGSRTRGHGQRGPATTSERITIVTQVHAGRFAWRSPIWTARVQTPPPGSLPEVAP
jgi:hypothetical protein